MISDNNEPRSDEDAAAALEEARRLARNFRRHMPEGEKRILGLDCHLRNGLL